MDSQISKMDKLIIYLRTATKFLRGGYIGSFSNKQMVCSL